jgi:GNAT superfamily N-acetyltransferase
MEWIADHKIDTLEQKIDFFKSESIFGTPAMPLALRANAELIDQKMALRTAIKNEHKIIWAQIGNVTVGGLCYKFKKFNTAFIVLSFTDPQYRGLGINLLCRQHFENECRNKNIKYITTEVHIDNKPSIDNNKKMGLKPIFTTMIKSLKKN